MRTLILIALLSSCLNVQAQELFAPILSNGDSVKVILTKDLNKVYPHTVQAKQTLYGICSLFELPVSYVSKINKLDKNQTLEIGQTVFIPLKDGIVLPHRPLEGTSIPIVYKVKAKETVFRISRIYFDIQTQDFKSLNKLTEDKLDIGQYVTVGYLKMDASKNVQASAPLDSLGVVSETGEIDSIEVSPPSWENQARYKKGIAFWDKKSSTTQLFVMHRTARINSEIELYNPVIGERVNARVVANIPPNTYPADIDVILSPATAKRLGALDSRFLVEMKYFE